jgi:DNA-binding MarR family transcriptional regulator
VNRFNAEVGPDGHNPLSNMDLLLRRSPLRMEKGLPLPWIPFVWDVNADGRFTVSDVGSWLQHAFFLPGDWLIWMMLRYVPEFGRFLEVDSGEYGSTFSALLSVFCWLAIAVLLMTTTHILAAADRALTRTLRGFFTRALTRWRIIRRLATEAYRRKRKQISSIFVTSDRPKLSPEEFRVLKAHAHIDPSSALALSDLVRATGVPRIQIVSILERLRELQLIDRRTNPQSNEQGYALTGPGRSFISAESL